MIKGLRLNIYFSKVFAKYFFSTLGVISLGAYLISLVETFNESFAHAIPSNLELMSLAFYQTPDTVLQIMPIIVLLSTIAFFLYIARSQQLLMAQQAGLSLRETMILPALLLLVLAIFIITLINPLSASLLEKRESFENSQQTQLSSLMSVVDTGIWLKQHIDQKSLIIHADRWDQTQQQFFRVSIYQFQDNTFDQRIEAEYATVDDKVWRLHNVLQYQDQQSALALEMMELQTDFDQEKINDSFVSASTVSIWRLSEFIETVENAGLNAKEHIRHFHHLLSLPIVLLSMFILTAGICYTVLNRQSVRKPVFITLVTGFGYFVFFSTFQSVGLFNEWPILLTTWLPHLLFFVVIIIYTITQETQKE